MMVLDGRDITAVYTFKSMYDHDCVAVESKDITLRLPMKTVMEMVKDYQFILEKKTKHTHMVKACRKDTI